MNTSPENSNFVNNVNSVKPLISTKELKDNINNNNNVDANVFQFEIKQELLNFKEINVKLELELESEKKANKYLKDELSDANKHINQLKANEFKNNEKNLEQENSNLKFKITRLETDKIELSKTIQDLNKLLKNYENKVSSMLNLTDNMENRYYTLHQNIIERQLGGEVYKSIGRSYLLYLNQLRIIIN